MAKYTGGGTASAIKAHFMPVWDLLNASRNEFIFVAPNKCAITQVNIVGSVGSNNVATPSTNWSFQVRNLTAAVNLLSNVKTTSQVALVADTKYPLNPDQNQGISAGDVIQLQIVKNSGPTFQTKWGVGVEWTD